MRGHVLTDIWCQQDDNTIDEGQDSEHSTTSDQESFDEWYGIDDEADSTTIAEAKAKPEENAARGTCPFCILSSKFYVSQNPTIFRLISDMGRAKTVITRKKSPGLLDSSKDS
jgi:hypothetical protein